MSKRSQAFIGISMAVASILAYQDNAKLNAQRHNDAQSIVETVTTANANAQSVMPELNAHKEEIRQEKDIYEGVRARHPYDQKVFDTYAANGLAFLDVTAAWCPPCRAIAPSLETLAAEKNIYFATMSADTIPQLDAAQALLKTKGLTMPDAIPYIVLFEHGKPIWTSEEDVSPECASTISDAECADMSLRYNIDTALGIKPKWHD